MRKGDRLSTGNDREIAEKDVKMTPPRLHSRFLEITLAVERVVRRALGKEPHQRFASVREFALALEQASKVPAVENRRRSSVVDLPAVVISRRGVAIEEPAVVVPWRRGALDPSPLVLRKRSAIDLPVTNASRRR